MKITTFDELLDEILPEGRPDDKPRRALVSYSMRIQEDGSEKGVYSGVPDPSTLARIKERCDEFYDLYKETEPGEYIDIEFEG